MNRYSTLNTIYIFITSTSVILSIVLLITILKSQNYITKWTLFQLCVAVLGYSITTLPTIIVYGDDILEKAPKTIICEIQCRVMLFFSYPLFLFSVVLPFYLCGVLNQNFLLEKKSFMFITMSIWGFSICYSSFVLVVSRNDKDNGIITTMLYCDTHIKEQWYYYWIYQLTTLGLAFIAGMLTFYSVIVLYQKWRRFNRNQNRKTAIQLGYAVRLSAYSFVYAMLIGGYMISNMFQPLETKDGELINRYRLSDFTTAMIGISLFLIFGRNRKAAICLPNCYHSPPNEIYRSSNYPSMEFIIDVDNNSSEGSKPVSPYISTDTQDRNVASSSSSSASTSTSDTAIDRNFKRNSFNVIDRIHIIDEENESISNLVYFGPNHKRHIRRLTV